MRLEVRHVSVSYDATKALRRVGFELEGGEILGVVGPNGAGKSTLLKVIAGVLKADEGRVLLDGETSRAARSGTSRSAARSTGTFRPYLAMSWRWVATHTWDGCAACVRWIARRSPRRLSGWG